MKKLIEVSNLKIPDKGAKEKRLPKYKVFITKYKAEKLADRFLKKLIINNG